MANLGDTTICGTLSVTNIISQTGNWVLPDGIKIGECAGSGACPHGANQIPASKSGSGRSLD